MNILEIFLIVNAFILGVVVTLAVQYFLAHRRNHATKEVPKQEAPSPVTPEVRERIAKKAEENLQGIVNRSALQLQNNLGSTTTQLNKLLEKFGSEVLDDEIKLFKDTVAELRNHTAGSLTTAQDEIVAQQEAILKSLAKRQVELDTKMAERQAMLEADLDKSLAEEKAALVKQLNERLNDAVIGFLLETLGHDVDLGAQTDYLLATLEENKAELLQSTIGSTVQEVPTAEAKS